MACSILGLRVTSLFLSAPSSFVWERSFVLKAVIKACGCHIFVVSASSTVVADRGPISSSHETFLRE